MFKILLCLFVFFSLFGMYLMLLFLGWRGVELQGGRRLKIYFGFFFLLICLTSALVFFIVLSLFYSTCSEENHCYNKINASGEI